MNKVKKKQIIKIPHNLNIFYSKKKNLLIVKGITQQKSFKLHKLLTVSSIEQHLEITGDNSKKLSNSDKKKIRLIQKTTISLIKQLLIEANAPMYQKLKFVGVGYRASLVENFENHLLLLRLGYSHPIYFKIPLKTQVFSLKFTKLFLYGYSYQKLTSTAAKIRLNKMPEPYKGKGILHENEQIILKEGKKI
jgi:large subunit ribosomal protein L6